MKGVNGRDWNSITAFLLVVNALVRYEPVLFNRRVMQRRILCAPLRFSLCAPLRLNKAIWMVYLRAVVA